MLFTFHVWPAEWTLNPEKVAFADRIQSSLAAHFLSSYLILFLFEVVPALFSLFYFLLIFGYIVRRSFHNSIIIVPFVYFKNDDYIIRNCESFTGTKNKNALEEKQPFSPISKNLINNFSKTTLFLELFGGNCSFNPIRSNRMFRIGIKLVTVIKSNTAQIGIHIVHRAPISCDIVM